MPTIFIAGAPSGVRVAVFDTTLNREDPEYEIVNAEVVDSDRIFTTEIDEQYSGTLARVVVRSAGFHGKDFNTTISELGIYRAVELQPDRAFSGSRSEVPEDWNSSAEFEIAQERVQNAFQQRLNETLEKKFAAQEVQLKSALKNQYEQDLKKMLDEAATIMHAPTGTNMGHEIIVRRNEILEAAPAIQKATEVILYYYEKNLPNDTDTQEFVSSLKDLSSGLDEYVLALQTTESEEEAEEASLSFIEKITTCFDTLDRTDSGDRISRLAAASVLLGVVVLAAPTVSPIISFPVLSACVFPKETGKATKMLKEVGKIITSSYKKNSGGSTPDT